MRHIVTQMLREQGYTVLPANGGAEALQIARRIQVRCNCWYRM